ncbi:MAG: BatD family protein [Candidatus Omnitrophica bacterium]|nr:BatD family protein [Candidatus Omnitrophota bacterium]
MKKILLMMMIFLSCCSFAVAAQYSLSADIEMDQVSMGNPVYFYITFDGSQNVSRPDMPAINGLKVNYVGPQAEMSIVNGVSSQKITFTYLIIPLENGSYKLGPYTVNYNGTNYSTRVIDFVVADGGGTRQEVGSQPINTGGNYQVSRDDIFVVIETPVESVYLNEVVPLKLKLYVENMGLKDIEFPVFNYDGFSADKWGEPEKRQELYNGKRYNVLLFTRDLIAIKEGDFTVGPALLSCKAVIPVAARSRPRSSMFGRSMFDDDFFSDIFTNQEIRPLELKSNSVNIKVKPFPAENKPMHFEGALGTYKMEVNIEPKKVNVGDPITVKTIISGKGNLDTVTVPYMENSSFFKTYEPQVVKKDDRKIYEQILIPKSSEIDKVPSIIFSYFDPAKGEYKTIKSDPVPIEVVDKPNKEEGVKVVSIQGSQEMIFPTEKLGRDIIHIKDDLGELKKKNSYIVKNEYFKYFWIPPFILYLLAYFLYMRKQKIRTDSGYARSVHASSKSKQNFKMAEKALRKGDMESYYEMIHKTLTEYLSGKLNLPKGGVTQIEVNSILKSKNVKENIIKEVNDVFTACDAARYASASIDKKQAKMLMGKLGNIMKSLFVLIVILILPAVYSHADNYANQQETFKKANEAYNKDEYLKAVDEYENILSTGYESPNLYFNLANAYFRSGDVGKAILNYKRAERFEPSNPDIKANLKFAEAEVGRNYSIKGSLWDMIIIQKYRQMMNLDERTMLTVIFYVFGMLLLSVGLFMNKNRKIVTFGIILVIVSILNCGILWHDAGRIGKEAVISVDNADILYGPFDSATVFFKLRKGSIVDILSTKNGWSKINRLDGKSGWVRTNELDII